MNFPNKQLSNNALASVLIRSLEEANNSGDIGRSMSVDKIIELGNFRGFEGLKYDIKAEAYDWLMTQAVSFDRRLKLATGRGRDEWLHYAIPNLRGAKCFTYSQL